MEQNPSLDSNSVFEILSRSSLKTVAKCRLLSKDYNRLTYESAFTDLHSQQTQTETGFFVQIDEYLKTSASFISTKQKSSSNFSLDFLPGSSNTIAASSVQGLLVCVGQKETRRFPQYYVCKPVTSEWKRIPNPKTRYSTVAIGIKVLKTNPLHYKIVRLSDGRIWYTDLYFRCEIFDSMSDKWRQIEQVKLPHEGLLMGRIPAISAYGKLHWWLGNKVFAFDVDDENYSYFPLPFPFNDYEATLADYEGKLAVICKREGCFDLWVSENYIRNEWSKRVTVSTHCDDSENGGKYLDSPLAFCNSDVALIRDFDKLVFFKFKTGKMIHEVGNVYGTYVFPFQSDYGPCNLRNKIFHNKSTNKRRRIRSRPIKEYLNDFIGRHSSFCLSPIYVFLLLLFFFDSVCYVLDVY